MWGDSGGATAGPNDESFEFLANALVVSVEEEAKVRGMGEEGGG